VLGLTLPRIESRYLPAIESGLTSSAAMQIFISVGTGMLALRGVVFSLLFVRMQFSAIAYSPRFMLWIAEGTVILHSLVIFTSAFLYSMPAIAWLDRTGSGKVPFFSGMPTMGNANSQMSLPGSVPMPKIGSSGSVT
jgi:uncharacterized membrane protein